MPKLRELQVIGNPLNYPIRDIVKKGSKYLIYFLQMKWKNDLNDGEIIQIDNNYASNTVIKVDNKLTKTEKKQNTKKIVIIYYINKLHE